MTRITRRSFAVGAAGIATAPWPARAQTATDYPAKPIRMVVPFPPGGGTDFLARLFAIKMGEGLKQSIVVENKPGAAATIGADAVSKAAPDGYTLLMVVRDMGINPSLQANMPFDTLKAFSWIGKAAEGHYVLCSNPNAPFKTFQELVTQAKAKPGSISYGSLGIGSLGHINVEAVKQSLGIDLLHVPYKGAGPALAATVSGEVAMCIAAYTGAVPFIKDGRVRGLCIGASKRTHLMPDVPTIVEAGGVADTLTPTHWGLAAPAGTPRPIIDKLNAELKRVLDLPDVREKIDQAGLEPIHSTPEALGELVVKDVERFGRLVKSIGITAQ